MSKKKYQIDEDVYPIAWRFNALDCLLSESDKKRIVLFESLESQRLWDTFIPVKNLIGLDSDAFKMREKVALDFECKSEPLKFFMGRLSFPDFIWFFWGRSSAGIVPREVFLKSWSDFFYPSDENSILLIPNSSRIIFSFDDMFFYGDLLKS